jgi:transcriptional regulator with PAS, ATPase and Fis domain
LVESELFGYSEGAFTGATRGGKPGKFELASQGTIFLDEIGDMPLEQQASLLRVIQERRIVRIGDAKDIPVDVRIICASNRSLKDEVDRGTFRNDLYYRLNVISIRIPPLRERKEDIDCLFRHFVQQMGQRRGYAAKKIEPGIMPYLLSYPWPGNVRELQNIVERMMNFSMTETLSVMDIPDDLLGMSDWKEVRRAADAASESASVQSIREQRQKRDADAARTEIIELLSLHGGNISAVSQRMGISRNTLYRKMRKYGIQ